MEIQLITVPYRYDEPDEGLGRGPGALLDAGIARRLSGLGHSLPAVNEARLPPDAREGGTTAVNIGRLGAKTAELVASARLNGQGVLVLAGDDTAAVGVVSGLQRSDGADAAIGVVWLDAHGDFNTPETSISGILAGMPLAIIAGFAGPLWRGAAGLETPIPTARILLGGVRDLDEKEAELLRTTDVHIVRARELRTGIDAFARGIRMLAETCTVILLHVDFDVLDPYLVPSSSTPAADGLEIAEVAAAMTAVLQTGKVAAICVSSLNPGGGSRAEASIKSAAKLIEQALANWTAVPALPTLL
jgi:arginase